VFPIDSSEENVFLYFGDAPNANTVFSITAKPKHRTSARDNQHPLTDYSAVSNMTDPRQWLVNITDLDKGLSAAAQRLRCETV